MSPPRRPLLTEGPIARTLLLFALPILGGTVLQSLNASVNAMWIGHFLGESALSATSNASQIIFLLLGMVFGVSMACTILVGQAIGARNIVEAKRVVGTSAGFFLILAVVVAGISFLLAPELLKAMGTPADALPYAVPYLRVIFLALPSMYLYNFLMMTLRGAGDSRTPFLFMGLSVVLDAGLNPVFIFGLGPFPRMGIAGSATATLIAQTAVLIALLVTLYARKYFLRITREELGFLRPNPAILRALVFKGLPMGLQMLVISLSAIIMMRLVNSYGSRTVAAYGAAAQLWNYANMPAMAIGGAVSAMAAQNVGARLWDRVDRIASIGVGYNFLLTGALVGLIYLFNGPALELFLPGDSAGLAIAVRLNAIIIWSFMFFGVTFVLFGVVRSTGAVWPPLIILTITMWLVRPPFALSLMPHYGSDAIWWSFPLGSMLAMFMAIGYYRWGGWRRARMLTEPDKPDALPPVPTQPAPAQLAE